MSNQIKPSTTDIEEITRVTEIAKQIDNMQMEEIVAQFGIIRAQQPFFISLLGGYEIDLESDEAGEIVLVLLMIWLYYADNEKIETNRLTEEMYDRLHIRNIQLLRYMEGERTQTEQQEVLFSDMSLLKSKALLTGILFRFNTRPSLSNMDEEKKGTVLIGMKALVESMDEVIGG